MPTTKDNVAELPFETAHLRHQLREFLNADYQGKPVGDYRYGVYAFYDYDGEPIYVGQTREKLRTRIRRHLTNQRTDAVAMFVLDPFEVCEIAVWPLPEFENLKPKDLEAAKAAVDQLEYSVHQLAIEKSQFGAILNEKDPPKTKLCKVPKPHRRVIVSEEVKTIRSHPDTRIARRALIISKLAQVINERKVTKGLRRTLLTQARRLQALAERRHKAAADIAADDEDSDD